MIITARNSNRKVFARSTSDKQVEHSLVARMRISHTRMAAAK